LPPPISRHTLEDCLGYQFNNPELLNLALTHPSYNQPPRLHNNQRLEFLGDAILQFTVSAWLYKKIPQATEGRLTAIRAALVNRHNLETWAHSLLLHRHIRVGKGIAKRLSGAVLADACEALLGAIYLDGGIEAAQKVILEHYEKSFPHIETISPQTHNPKGALQEWLQSHGAPPPVYRLIRTQGPSHAASFTVEVKYLNQTAQAAASSKKQAEIEAARIALQSLQIS
jgi:ribonuclease-3